MKCAVIISGSGRNENTFSIAKIHLDEFEKPNY